MRLTGSRLFGTKINKAGGARRGEASYDVFGGRCDIQVA